MKIRTFWLLKEVVPRPALGSGLHCLLFPAKGVSDLCDGPAQQISLSLHLGNLFYPFLCTPTLLMVAPLMA